MGRELLVIFLLVSIVIIGAAFVLWLWFNTRIPDERSGSSIMRAAPRAVPKLNRVDKDPRPWIFDVQRSHSGSWVVHANERPTIQPTVMRGWGQGVREGDFLLWRDQSLERHRVLQIVHTSPQQWVATVEPVARSYDEIEHDEQMVRDNYQSWPNGADTKVKP